MLRSARPTAATSANQRVLFTAAHLEGANAKPCPRHWRPTRTPGTNQSVERRRRPGSLGGRAGAAMGDGRPASQTAANRHAGPSIVGSDDLDPAPVPLGFITHAPIAHPAPELPNEFARCAGKDTYSSRLHVIAASIAIETSAREIYSYPLQ